MKRLTELVIIFSTLAAIVSTFLLYRSHSFTPQQTASVIGAEEELLSITNTEMLEAETATTTTEEEAETISNEASSTELPAANKISIEKLPITVAEIATLSSRIHTLTNLSRSQNNLSNFTLDPALSVIAERRSQEMIDKNYFSHTSPSGCDITCQMKSSGYQTLAWGENLALSNSYHLYTLPELAQTFITDWLRSDTHRDNILSKKFTHHGIGIASQGDRIVVTVVFAAQ